VYPKVGKIEKAYPKIKKTEPAYPKIENPESGHIRKSKKLKSARDSQFWFVFTTGIL